MKKVTQFWKRALALTLALTLILSVSVFSAFATVNTVGAIQFCGAYIELGGVDYLCAVDLGAPAITPASETTFSPGTTVRFDLFFCINDAWYPVRETELQGNPADLFVLQFDKTSGGECVSDISWKTYTDDEFGAKYYAEFTILGADEATPLDVSIALTQPDVPNVGAEYQITGTVAAKEYCVADFNLGNYTGPCSVDLTQPILSTGNANAMTPGSTVCFPLMFIGGDGVMYPAYDTELQGNPADLFVIDEEIISGDAILSYNGWKTWDNHHWFLEYLVASTTAETALEFSVRLTQPEIFRQSSKVEFLGLAPATAPIVSYCWADINIGGTVYPAQVDFRGCIPVDTANLAPGTTVRLPLMFMGGDDVWYAVRANELQGAPADLFTIAANVTQGSDAISDFSWVAIDDDGYGAKYYAEFTVVGGTSAQALALTAQLTQPAAGHAGDVVSINGTIAAKEFCVADFVLPGYTGPCYVDFGGPLTSTGNVNAMTGGSTICFPLMFIGGDSVPYAAFDTELQGNPEDLFSVEETFTSGGALLSCNGWKTWDNHHWFLEYQVAPGSCNAALEMSVSLVQNDIYRQSSTVGFVGTTPDHNFVDGVCENCGQDDPNAPVLKIKSASLRLDEDIDVIYTVLIPDVYTNAYMVINGTTISTSEISGNYYLFTYTGITPQRMTDNISATLYATKDGVTESDTIASYSIKQYCANMLTTNADNAALKTLLSDLLTYGAAAQIYTNYNTDNLATSGLDLTPSTFSTISGKAVSFTGTADASLDWTAATLVLGNTVATRFYFAADDISTLSIDVTIGNSTETFDEFVSMGSGKYYIDFFDIEATQFDSTISASFYVNGTATGRTINYSINAYICGTQNSVNSALQTLVRALYNYGASAAAYAANN